MDEQSQAMMQMQLKLADAETSKAAAAQSNVMVKGQAEAAKHQREMDKMSYEAQLAQAKAENETLKTMLDQREKSEQLNFNYDQLATQTALKLTEIEAQTKQQEEQNFNDNMKGVNDGQRGASA